MASIFWDEDVILLVYYLKKGATITANYYTSLLGKVKQALVSKWLGKLPKGVLFLQHNASSYTTAIMQRKLADLHSDVPKHPAYSRDLTSSEYHLFPNLKKHMKGKKFSITEDAMSAADDWFAAQPSAFYLDGLKNLEQHIKQCAELMGEYVE
jgi:glutathione S-transferase